MFSDDEVFDLDQRWTPSFFDLRVQMGILKGIHKGLHLAIAAEPGVGGGPFDAKERFWGDVDLNFMGSQKNFEDARQQLAPSSVIKSRGP